MSLPVRPRIVAKADGAGPGREAKPCPACARDEPFCGCVNPRGPGERNGLVSVISGDAAVRRALVLMLEAEGMAARAFCAWPRFAQAMERAPAQRRHCLLMDEEQARGIDAAWLAGRGGGASIVVLSASRGARHHLPPGCIAFADPFRVDEVLQAVRDALAAT